MPKCYDLTGRVFGYLTVLERAPTDVHGNIMWLARCRCGNITKVKTTSLICQTRSCGCVRKKSIFQLTETHETA